MYLQRILKTMKSNQDLQKEIQEALKWEPLLHAAEIGVIVKDGIVTLTGTVDSYAKKLEAENATKKVAGVKALVEKIEIKHHNSSSKLDDTEIAQNITQALKWNLEVPKEKVRVKVEHGWITLEGELQWKYQSDCVIGSVKNLLGVTGISNKIKIKPSSEDTIELQNIVEALRRNWSIDDRNIEVSLKNHNVVISGKVNSWYEKNEAERIAWNAPGVWNVINELVVDYHYEFVE
jgi:osmotically-inducible protein OsmY